MLSVLEGREGSVYGRATALYGLRHSEASIAWADEMLGALDGVLEIPEPIT